ncbi:hypothetical protein CRE_24856 [Caenorhabditis remanei]|uniref:Sdz-33 F-box domain-containing protein n=1 Tax=Caenorhabditis remanei TaxID=31234 RepID=E3NLB7_CAERE|nr:hypothetical protein CRE_24856 [Caenorhabditis remanei]
MAGIDKRRIKTVNIGGHLVPSYMKREHRRGSECLVTYWVDQKLGMRMIIDYSSKLFNNYEISTVLMGKDDFYIIDYLMSRQKSVPDVEFSGHKEIVTEDQYLYLLRNAIVTKHLSIASSPPENFQYSGTFQNYGTLILGFGFWVTLDNLVAMNSTVVIIRGSKLTSSEFNRYLKNWLSGGGSSEIKYLSVEVKSLDLNLVFKDLENQVVLVEKRRQYTWMEEGVLEVGHSYDLTRDDGVTATVNQAAGRDGTRMFEMVVWPDFYGSQL